MMTGWTMGVEAWIWMGVWVLAIGLVVWLLIREPRHEDREDALQVLRSRLARGEITPEEFERARRLLDT